MTRILGKIALLGLAAVLLAGAPASAHTAAAKDTPPATAKTKAVQFNGKLKAVDKKEKSITIENKTMKDRVFFVTSDTKILKGKKPATFDDLTVGDGIRGSYVEADGKMNLATLAIQIPKAPTADTPPATAK
jgi:membrane-bound lytic murein transglycosylase B